MKEESDFAIGCPCLKCDPSGKRFKAYYGRFPWEERRTRRTSGEVAIEKREKTALQSRKAEARARFYKKNIAQMTEDQRK